MTVQNTTADLDPLEAEMLKLAEAADAGEEVSMENLDRLTVETEDKEKANETPKEGDSPDDEGGDKNDLDDDSNDDELDDEGNPIRKEGDDAEAAKKAAEEEAARKKEEEKASKSESSEYAKAREKREKERERLSGGWQKLDKEKESVRTMEAELKAREAELAEREKKLSAPRYTSEDYEEVARKMEEKGERHLAESARKKAEALKKAKTDSLTESLETQAKKREEFVEAWNKNFEALKKEEPELGDLKSKLSLQVAANLKEIPGLSYTPDGLTHAVKLAKLQDAESRAEKLGEELEAAQKEIDRLTELTSIEEGGHQGRPKPKTFDEMSSAEQEAYLERQAEEFDRSG